MAKIADVYFDVDPWKVIETGFDPSYSRVSESVFSLANETMGVRGFFDEGYGGDGLRGCYTNGVFDIENIGRSYRGIIDHTHFMIPSADWLLTWIVLDGEKLDLDRVRFRDFRRELDMRAGMLLRSFVWQTQSGKELRLTVLRFLDMRRRERAYQRITFEALNFDGTVSLSTGVTFDVVHEGYKKCFWQETRLEAADRRLMAMSRTTASGQEVFAGAVIDLPCGSVCASEGRTALLRAEIPLKRGEKVSAEKRAVILCTGECGDSLWEKGKIALSETEKVSLGDALEAQKAYWEAYWRTSDIQIEAAREEDAVTVAAEQQGIRFCSYQLAQTYNGGSMRHNIGAKGMTGEAYNGHAFWDTEACCLPFYLFNDPEAAKYLLLFRYNTLPRALERAKMLDCDGACYPIATLNGEEACALWQHASLQIQPTTAVAYGIWHYVHVTGDEEFLHKYGAEMLVQIARFLVSRSAQSSGTGKYGFYGVMGPDEFHMMVNNDAYTNYMGMLALAFAADTVGRMKENSRNDYDALKAKTGMDESETGRWRTVADNMYFPIGENGVIEQHEGFYSLPHTEINDIPAGEFPLYEHWSYDRIYRTDMIKQPAVLMIMYLFNSSFSEELKRANYDFYEPRTIHESSLSPAIHSVLAAELGKMPDAVRFFGYATRLDLDNYNRNTREGLHVTSIAMAWANIVYGFGGMRSDGEMLSFAPHLPERWKKLDFSVMYRGSVVEISMECSGTTFTLKEGSPVTVRIYGKTYNISDTALKVPAQ